MTYLLIPKIKLINVILKYKENHIEGNMTYFQLLLFFIFSSHYH